MHREGHYGASLLAYAPLGFIVVAIAVPTTAVGGAVLVVVLAMLPDQAQRLPGIKYRGVTHTAGSVEILGS